MQLPSTVVISNDSTFRNVSLDTEKENESGVIFGNTNEEKETPIFDERYDNNDITVDHYDIIKAKAGKPLILESHHEENDEISEERKRNNCWWMRLVVVSFFFWNNPVCKLKVNIQIFIINKDKCILV